ncbi:MAG TPA: hypothetical protein PK513_08135 [Alphaproteobacteria bacterium]|nr:hypothetical protein [Alphaproteobacteria bacterium]USO06241.1 MAG: hypothetical protein H6859_03340 [Rhodospirillales bacterium]HOO82455.1 hypothetical protein [Alphaproteobacteria bacterium]
MNTTFLKFGAQASMALLWASEAFAADSEEFIGKDSSAPDYIVEDGAVHAVDKRGEAAIHVGEHAGEHVDVAHHASSGLPQMDPTWFPSQIFWLAVTFLCLYVILSRKILPEISGTLEARRMQIQEDLDSAQSLKEEAEDVHQAYDEILDGARKKASELFERAEEDIKTTTNKKLDELRERANKENTETEKQIEKAKTDAMADMYAVAAEIASLAAEKIVGISTDIDQAKSLVKNIDKKAA